MDMTFKDNEILYVSSERKEALFDDCTLLLKKMAERHLTINEMKWIVSKGLPHAIREIEGGMTVESLPTLRCPKLI